MDVGNGDLHVSDRIQANGDLVAELEEKGSVYFDTDVNVEGEVRVKTSDGDINVGNDVQATKDITMTAKKGSINVGAAVASTGGEVNLAANQGDITIGKEVRAEAGSIGVQVVNGEVTIGNNGPDVETVTAKNNIDIHVETGKIKIYGKTSTENGDIYMSASEEEYIPGNQNIIIAQNGLLEAGRDINLTGRNGDLHVTDAIRAKRDMSVYVLEEGGVAFDAAVNVAGKVTAHTEKGPIAIDAPMTADMVSLQADIGNISSTGDISANTSVDVSSGVGNISMKNVSAQGGVDISAGIGNLQMHDIEAGGDAKVAVQTGSVNMRDIDTKGNADVTIGQGNLSMNDITSEGAAKVELQNGSINMRDIEAKGNAAVTVSQGNLDMKNMVAGSDASINLGTGNMVAEDVTAGRNAKVAMQNGEIRMHDVNAAMDATVENSGHGSIHANNITSWETTHVALTNGDLFLNLAEGKAVLLKMENNTAASRVNQVLAEAGGGTGSDVMMTGNFIHIGTMAAKNGDSVFQLSAMGAGKQKLIEGDFSVESLSSKHGTQMPYLWSKRGYLHVDEGDVAVTDVLAVDKIHLDNKQTDLAIYGRTPTRDGEQLVYWNNLGMANSKERGFRLYTDGKLRTSRAILIDADRNYGKLYGDNLSVVDMMRERVGNTHGSFTFDSALLTEPGKALREQVFFDMEPAKADIQQKSSSDEKIVVE